MLEEMERKRKEQEEEENRKRVSHSDEVCVCFLTSDDVENANAFYLWYPLPNIDKTPGNVFMYSSCVCIHVHALSVLMHVLFMHGHAHVNEWPHVASACGDWRSTYLFSMFGSFP